MDGTLSPTMTATILPRPYQLNRVYRCAWCHGGAPVVGSLPFYTYRADGCRVAADPKAWSGSDGLCPGHGAKIRAELRRPDLAA